MTETPTAESQCGHTYRTLGGFAYTCEAPAHPTRPRNHYFVRNPAADIRGRVTRSLVRGPGSADG